ncbi:MAG: matrixin family metalloprotease [Deltaproteobacteria bacterium]|nr:matrixin family metalloprotease [Deltaproteobacteria bacterium]
MARFFLLLFFLLSTAVHAGGPILVNSSGVASEWDNASDISYHPESGTCATFSNEEMLGKIEENIALWSDISGMVLSFAASTGEIPSVDGDNYDTYFSNSADDAAEDGLNPVIFDDDGAIISDLFGASNRFAVLGFAGPVTLSSDEETILEGQAFFNCFCLADNPSDSDGDCDEEGVLFTEADLDFVMTHEFGHMIGLDHTQVNQPMAADCDTEVADDCDELPAMFPVSVDAEDQITPQRDDEIALLALYGDSLWAASFCTVTGTLLDSNGDELRCADVQAETSDQRDAIALVSGIYAETESGECVSGCGDFMLIGIDPDKNYTITVKPVDPAWVGGSGINPCWIDQPTGVEEEAIGNVVDCTAGETIDLGSLTTESSGDDSSAGSGSGSASACGEDQNFDACDPIIGGCSLRTPL